MKEPKKVAIHKNGENIQNKSLKENVNSEYLLSVYDHQENTRKIAAKFRKQWNMQRDKQKI